MMLKLVINVKEEEFIYKEFRLVLDLFNKFNKDVQSVMVEEKLLKTVEAYTINELMPALAKGGFLDTAKKQSVAAQMAIQPAAALTPLATEIEYAILGDA